MGDWTAGMKPWLAGEIMRPVFMWPTLALKVLMVHMLLDDWIGWKEQSNVGSSMLVGDSVFALESSSNLG